MSWETAKEIILRVLLRKRSENRLEGFSWNTSWETSCWSALETTEYHQEIIFPAKIFNLKNNMYSIEELNIDCSKQNLFRSFFEILVQKVAFSKGFLVNDHTSGFHYYFKFVAYK